MKPLVSIGMPVFNESRFIKTSLHSVINQDYKNLEIIISDNSSTDATYSICEELLGERPNVRMHRHTKNNGAAENFNFVASSSGGEYFMWASGHDIWSPNYISSCVELMEKFPDVVLAFGTPLWIDEHGEYLRKSSGYSDTRGMHPMTRYMITLWSSMNPILGVIRKSALDQILPFRAAIGSDLIALSQLAIEGEFAHVTDASWCRREFRYERSHAQKIRRYQSSEYQLAKRSTFSRIFPLARLPFSLSRLIISTSSLTWIEKVSLVAALTTILPARYLDGKRQ